MNTTFSERTVRDWLTPSPVVTPATSVGTALRLTAEFGLPALPVVCGAGFAGLVYERDLLRFAPSEATTLDRFELHEVPGRLTVARLVRPAEGVAAESPLREAVGLMLRGGTGVLPVVQAGVPVGLLLWRSVLAALAGPDRAA